MDNILNSAFDKKSSLRAILKSIYLVSSLEHINIIGVNEKLNFYQNIQNNSTIKHFVTKKSLWNTWSGLFEFVSVDFFIGIVINLSSLGILFATGFDTSPLYFVLTVFFNYIGISAWMHFFDFQLHGNTNTNKFVDKYFSKLSEFQIKYDKISNTIKSRLELSSRSWSEYELSFNDGN